MPKKLWKIMINGKNSSKLLLLFSSGFFWAPELSSPQSAEISVAKDTPRTSEGEGAGRHGDAELVTHVNEALARGLQEPGTGGYWNGSSLWKPGFGGWHFFNWWKPFYEK